MYIKGFDKDLRCRGMQFEVGKEYSTGVADADISLCTNTVFHFCDSLRKVHTHYSVIPKEDNRFCEIEVLGALVSDDTKCGSNRIRIVREILGDELNIMRGLTNENAGIFNSGATAATGTAEISTAATGTAEISTAAIGTAVNTTAVVSIRSQTKFIYLTSLRTGPFKTGL